MKKMSIFAVALGLLLVAAAGPALAVCTNARLITSNNTGDGVLSYVYTPGVTSEGVSGSTVTPQFAGTFWALGEGSNDPGIPGADSGAFPALEWLYIYPNYPAFLNTAWSADERIDGCIDSTPATCTVMQLTDTDPSTGEAVFAVLSSEADGFANYFFDQDGGAPITLAALPPVEIVNSTRVGETGIIVDVAALEEADFDGGLFLDPDCGAVGGGGTGIGVVSSAVQWYFQVLARGAQPPTDNNIGTGGWVDSGVQTPYGAPATVNVPCTGDSDVYVSYAFVNESGIPAESTAGAATRTECGPNLADPAQRVRVKPSTRESKPRNNKN